MTLSESNTSCAPCGEREVNGAQRPVLVNEAESPLGWLKSRKDRNGRPLITEDQYQAGERLRADYWFAHLTPAGDLELVGLRRHRNARAGRRRQTPRCCATT